MTSSSRPDAVVEALDVKAYTLPTDQPESDGTLAWSATTMVAVLARCGAATGLGYSYTGVAAASVIESVLADAVVGRDVLAVPAMREAMVRAIRNLGRPGICSSAIAAVDCALWDLKARVLGISLGDLFGRARDEVPVYGSGGFTSYDDERLVTQLRDWARSGIGMVKMKIGRDARADGHRVRIAADALGPDVALFVDANGAYDRKQALAMAERMATEGVAWFEEPVSSDDLEGLRLLRDRAPASMDIAAGEYGYDLTYFRRMLDAGAVDVLQADATRCGGYSGFLRAAALCRAHHVPLSAHTAPNLHAHVCCALPQVCHIELFHDHVRLEELLLTGTLAVRTGALAPQRTQAGNGLALREDAARWQVHGSA